MLSEEEYGKIKELCSGKKNIKLSVGLLEDEKATNYLFGCDGVELPYIKYVYEIGSITKTFTAAILGKALKANIVTLEDRINKYIPGLPEDKVYPTIGRLATHSSGYPGDDELIEGNIDEIFDRNPYDFMDYDRMLDTIQRLTIEDRSYPFKYSNFGIGLLGCVLEKALGVEFDELMMEVIRDFGLQETYLGYGYPESLNLDGYTIDDKQKGREFCTGHLLWDKNEVVRAAGYLFTTMDDLLKYAKGQIDDITGYLDICHEKYGTVSSGKGLLTDIGLCWIRIPDLNISMHNGGTLSFRSVLCIDRVHRKAVSILSNYMVDEMDQIAINILRSRG